MPSPIGYVPGLTCVVQVSDLHRSLAWYTEKLGFQKLYAIDDMGWAELATEVPGVNLGLSQVETVPPSGNTKLTFGVKDIDAARKLLESQGVTFDGETMTLPGMVKLATFKDPDGNVHMFYESLAKK